MVCVTWENGEIPFRRISTRRISFRLRNRVRVWVRVSLLKFLISLIIQMKFGEMKTSLSRQPMQISYRPLCVALANIALLKKLHVNPNPNPRTNVIGRYDICNGCRETLLNETEPRKWRQEMNCQRFRFTEPSIAYDDAQLLSCVYDLRELYEFVK